MSGMKYIIKRYPLTECKYQLYHLALSLHCQATSYLQPPLDSQESKGPSSSRTYGGKGIRPFLSFKDKPSRLDRYVFHCPPTELSVTLLLQAYSRDPQCQGLVHFVTYSSILQDSSQCVAMITHYHIEKYFFFVAACSCIIICT